jgi:hypothetical protein
LNNFTLVNCDTDSISFCHPTGNAFTKEEQDKLLVELNSIFPKSISWEHDGFFPSVVVIKSKNYILKDEKGKVKIKGSALRSPNKEVALKEFTDRLIDCLLNDKVDQAKVIYEEYVKECFLITDIIRWCSKKTITSKVLDPQRTNEQSVFDAIQGSDYVEGDKCYFYFDMDGKPKLREKWTNDHDPVKLLGKLYNTACIFETVLNKADFPNYALVKNQNIAREMAGIPVVIKEKKTRKKKDAKESN